MKHRKKLTRNYIHYDEQVHEIFYRGSRTVYINLDSKSNLIIYKM